MLLDKPYLNSARREQNILTSVTKTNLALTKNNNYKQNLQINYCLILQLFLIVVLKIAERYSLRWAKIIHLNHHVRWCKFGKMTTTRVRDVQDGFEKKNPLKNVSGLVID